MISCAIHHNLMHLSYSLGKSKTNAKFNNSWLLFFKANFTWVCCSSQEHDKFCTRKRKKE